MIGGLSWESSQLYYQIINQRIKEKLGGFNSARCLLESVNFAEIEKLQAKNDWDALDKLMAQAAINLENAQADLIILCANTMHLCNDAIVNNVNIPFLHIARETGKRIKSVGLEKVLLLGTKFTMENDFFVDILYKEFDIEAVVPHKADRDIVHNAIYSELVRGIINPASKEAYQRIITEMAQKGAQGVILGCTEIPLLIQASDVDIPVFDTTRIHAEAAVDFSIENNL